MVIEQHPFFKKVSSDQLTGLVKASEVLVYPRAAVVFEENAPSDSIYLILKGQVIFRKRLPTGHRLTVSMSEPGSYFGEIGVLTEEPRSLEAEAQEGTELVRVPKIALLRYLDEMPGPAESLLQSVIRHLHQTTRHYVEDMVHQEKMAVVGTMMNTIIHDFKNPFCLISLSAQLLRQRHADAQSFRLCRNIEEQVERMVGMAADLTEFSRGEYRLNPVPLDLHALLEEFRALNSPFFETENVTVTVNVPPVRVKGEKTKLIRVFQNLIGNAIEAIGDEATGRIDITSGKSPDRRFVVIQVRDNGPGIPLVIRDRFFEPFVTHGKSEGTGLGSAIVKSIVDAHGGSIRFDTVTGEGTIFYVSLPLAEA
jgi:signal transduction histidine kinase